MSPEKNCTEKQPQMVLYPSSLCHKLNRSPCTAHPASPSPPQRPVLLIWLSEVERVSKRPLASASS